MDTQKRITTWSDYIELPQRRSQPIKLDRLLKKRMKAFLKARAARLQAKG